MNVVHYSQADSQAFASAHSGFGISALRRGDMFQGMVVFANEPPGEESCGHLTLATPEKIGTVAGEGTGAPPEGHEEFGKHLGYAMALAGARDMMADSVGCGDPELTSAQKICAAIDLLKSAANEGIHVDRSPMYVGAHSGEEFVEYTIRFRERVNMNGEPAASGKATGTACPGNCGTKIMSPVHSFCWKCGTPLKEPARIWKYRTPPAGEWAELVEAALPPPIQSMPRPVEYVPASEPLVVYVQTPNSHAEIQNIRHAVDEIHHRTGVYVVLSVLDDKTQVAVMQRMARLEEACKAMLAAHDRDRGINREAVSTGKALMMASDALRGPADYGQSPLAGLYREFIGELESNVKRALAEEHTAMVKMVAIDEINADPRLGELVGHVDKVGSCYEAEWQAIPSPAPKFVVNEDVYVFNRYTAKRYAGRIEEVGEKKCRVRLADNASIMADNEFIHKAGERIEVLTCIRCGCHACKVNSITQPVYGKDGRLVDHVYRGAEKTCLECGHVEQTGLAALAAARVEAAIEKEIEERIMGAEQAPAFMGNTYTNGNITGAQWATAKPGEVRESLLEAARRINEACRATSSQYRREKAAVDAMTRDMETLKREGVIDDFSTPYVDDVSVQCLVHKGGRTIEHSQSLDVTGPTLSNLRFLMIESFACLDKDERVRSEAERNFMAGPVRVSYNGVEFDAEVEVTTEPATPVKGLLGFDIPGAHVEHKEDGSIAVVRPGTPENRYVQVVEPQCRCGRPMYRPAPDMAFAGQPCPPAWICDECGGVYYKPAETDSEKRIVEAVRQLQQGELAAAAVAIDPFGVGEPVRLKVLVKGGPAVMYVEGNDGGQVRCRWTKGSGLVERKTFAIGDLEAAGNG
jgi:uncharacterized protein YodC (DUF2158 family)